MPYWGLSTAHYNSVLKQYKVDSFVSVILTVNATKHLIHGLIFKK